MMLALRCPTGGFVCCCHEAVAIRHLPLFGLAALALLIPIAGASVDTCEGTANLPASVWTSAADFALWGGEELRTGRLTWTNWSYRWSPLGRQTFAELEHNLQHCPEGTVAAIVHSLTALDEEDGDSTSLELVKLLYHYLSDKRPPPATLVPSPWQQHWLFVVSSLLRFVYHKWVNVPQDEPGQVVSGSSTITVAVSKPELQRHHAFLFKNTVAAFVKSGVYEVELTENSVLFSEAFAFAAFCQLHEVDLVLESGIYKGQSTELWSTFARDVLAVDVFVPPEAEARLHGLRNVQVFTGDGRRLLPQLLNEHPGRPTAVFIDGPKGELAIRLALSLLKYPQVAFVAMHDMAPYRRELLKLGAFFFSDESWYQAAYGYLDEPFKMRPDLEAGGTMAFLPRAA